MRNIVTYLQAHARKHPDKTAYIFLANDGVEEGTISYKDLYRVVQLLASHLTELQLTNERVLLLYQNTRDFIISFLACQYAGVVPIPAPFPGGGKQFARLQSIMMDAEVRSVLCTSRSVQVLKKELDGSSGTRQTDIFPTDLPDIPAAFENCPETSFNELSFIQYTSGSTGRPKGVVVTSENLLNNQESIRATFGCNEDSIIFSWLPFHHDMGLIGNVLHTIYTGATCILMSPFHFMQRPRSWLEGISRYRATHSGGPNFAYDLCIEKVSPDEVPALDLSCWKVAYCGSEPVRWETIQGFAGKFAVTGFVKSSFFPCYGLAESTLLVSGYRNGGLPSAYYVERVAGDNGKMVIAEEGQPDTQHLVSNGKIADGIDVRIMSDMGQHECEELEEGEICISGESVAAGYWGKDNRELFYEVGGRRMLRTGDLGFLYGGELFICGRIKEMMIVRGRNIFPNDIERAVSESIECVESNGVAVFSIDEMKECLVAIAEIKRSFLKDLDSDRVIHAVDRILMGRFGIRLYDIVLTIPKGIPRTTSGKLQRVKCKDMYKLNEFNMHGSKRSSTSTGMEVEADKGLKEDVLSIGDYKSIRKYVIQLIERKTGHLFEGMPDATALTDMGIDSLRATELVNLVNRELHIHLDVAGILQENSLPALIRAIENNLWLRTSPVVAKEITL